MSIPESMRISRHAAHRCAQRGISPKCLVALLEQADVEIAVGDGATAFSVSRKQVTALNLPGKLGRYAAIVSEDSTVITVAPMHGGQRGRHWRRGFGNGRGRG